MGLVKNRMAHQKYNDYLICFDLDGVLINSMEPAIRIFFETMGRELGLTYDFRADRKMWALAPREKIDVLWRDEIRRRGITQEQIDKAMAIYQKGKMEANIPALPYAREAMALLANRFENIAVVSGNANFMVEGALKKLDVLSYVKKITGTDDVALSKPDPAIYRKTVEYFNLLPGHTLAFEDSSHGIAAAKGAGAKAIGVATGVETFEELQKTPADAVLHNLSELTLDLVFRTLRVS